MHKQSPAQRRRASCGPAFRKSYLDDGMTYAAGMIISGYRQFDAVGEARRSMLDFLAKGGRYRGSERALLVKSMRVHIETAAAALSIGRNRSRLP
jgi:hypothetical protein